MDKKLQLYSPEPCQNVSRKAFSDFMSAREYLTGDIIRPISLVGLKFPSYPDLISQEGKDHGKADNR